MGLVKKPRYLCHQYVLKQVEVVPSRSRSWLLASSLNLVDTPMRSPFNIHTRDRRSVLDMLALRNVLAGLTRSLDHSYVC